VVCDNGRNDSDHPKDDNQHHKTSFHVGTYREVDGRIRKLGKNLKIHAAECRQCSWIAGRVSRRICNKGSQYAYFARVRIHLDVIPANHRTSMANSHLRNTDFMSTEFSWLRFNIQPQVARAIPCKIRVETGARLGGCNDVRRLLIGQQRSFRQCRRRGCHRNLDKSGRPQSLPHVCDFQVLLENYSAVIVAPPVRE
jgi:hypothetical protein